MSEFKISPGQVFPSSFPIFPVEEEDDPLVGSTHSFKLRNCRYVVSVPTNSEEVEFGFKMFWVWINEEENLCLLTLT